MGCYYRSNGEDIAPMAKHLGYPSKGVLLVAGVSRGGYDQPPVILQEEQKRAPLDEAAREARAVIIALREEPN